MIIFGQSFEPIVVKAEGDFEQELNQLINNDPNLNGAIIGISIRSAKTGKIIYEHLGDVRLKPASTLKIFTAAAALETLGPNYQFSTDILTDGEIKGKKLKGNLYLKGKGDPTLLISDFEKMAERLKQKGVKVIKGDLLADASWYDDIPYSIDLPWSDEHTYYGAQVSALTVSPSKDLDNGTVLLEIKPAKKAGKRANVTIIPKTDTVTITNHIKTVQKDNGNSIVIKREHGNNNIVLNGSIAMGTKKMKEWIAVWNPTLYALELFKQSMKNKGIKVEGKLKEDLVPKNAKLLITHQSIPLSGILIPFMKLSNNGHAEILVKEMGKFVYGEGSWDKGLKVVENQIKKLGVNTHTLVLRDGSGVSHINMIPANELSSILFTVQNRNWFPVFLTALPSNGETDKLVGGTLRNRLKSKPFRGRIKAKTGTLTTVSSLAGYIETNNGEKLVFAILLNNLIDESKGKMIEDRIMSILLE
ncbi:D-alanyl-D-alanine carboxypeptidase/D-alanyl-D-alanine endopeptidase [Neobacillus sp. D3-1R]|uniref:D-alanyl-D-alanine carboxypeptidase/D-alanyl-D-alanine endopeptidase n=1 Tax=Neobacillus sp. D3-1R TaxID=3445778 RepID=UPI003FA05BB2